MIAAVNKVRAAFVEHERHPAPVLRARRETAWQRPRPARLARLAIVRMSIRTHVHAHVWHVSAHFLHTCLYPSLCPCLCHACTHAYTRLYTRTKTHVYKCMWTCAACAAYDRHVRRRHMRGCTYMRIYMCRSMRTNMRIYMCRHAYRHA